MTKEHEEAMNRMRDELAGKRHRIYPSDSEKVREQLNEWANEFMDGFDAGFTARDELDDKEFDEAVEIYRVENVTLRRMYKSLESKLVILINAFGVFKMQGYRQSYADEALRALESKPNEGGEE